MINFRLLVLRIAIRILEPNVSYRDVDENAVIAWLSEQAQDPRFGQFFAQRDIQILKSMAIGHGHNDYLIMLGQRFEHLRLLQKVDEARKRKLVEDKKRVADAAAKAKTAKAENET